MELRIKDRLILPMLLPQEGNFKQFNLKKSIVAKVALTNQEREDINLRENSDTGRVEWDMKKDAPLVVTFTQEEMDFLKESFEELTEESLHDEKWDVITKIYDMMQSQE